MSRKILLSIMVCALSLIGASAVTFAQEASKDARGGTASINGQITFDGKPIPGATIYLMKQLNSIVFNAADITATTKADADGNFQFTSLPEGKYGLTAYAPGLIQTPEGTWGQVEKNIILSAGESFKTDIQLKRGAVISGRVTDRDGNPIVEEPVRLYGIYPGTTEVFMTSCVTCGTYTTDDRGIYRQYGLAPGRYLVAVGQASGTGGAGLRDNIKLTYSPNTTDKSKAKIVTLTAGEEVSDIDIVVVRSQKTFSVSGRVIDSTSGAPLSNIGVRYGSLSPDKKQVYASSEDVIRTTANGEFRINGFSPGEFGLQLGIYGNDEVYSDLIQFVVTDSDISSLDIKAHSTLTLKGSIEVEGPVDPALLARLSELGISGTQMFGGYSHRAVIVPDGSFSIPGMKPGAVSVSVGQINNPIRGFSLVRIEGNAPIKGDQIQVSTPESASGIKIILGYSTSRIHGQVRIAGNVQPISLRLTATPVEADRLQTVRYAQLDSSGKFTMEGLPPGQYRLFASAEFRPSAADAK